MPLPLNSVPGERTAFVKTKIVATVGPACETHDKLREMVVAGADLFRLNLAHGAHDWLDGIVASIRLLSVELEQPIGILADLSGPKIRLEEIDNDLVACPQGAVFEFARERDPARPNRLTCTYDKLIDDLQAGDRVLLADGTVSMFVTAVDPEEGVISCMVDQPGEIRSRQGINLPGVELSTPSLTEKDEADLAWAVKAGVDYVGLSFVRRAEDIRHLQSKIDAFNSATPPQIIAKIEKMEAIEDLERILEVTDCVMVARGDLGVEADIARVPGLQKRIIRLCNQLRVPVITATQMLDSMQHNSRPTRAEASDVANAVLDGSDAIMLSGESAIGKHPVGSVTMMARLALEAERLTRGTFTSEPSGVPRSRALAVTEAVTRGAVIAAEMLSASLIVVATHSGRTALAVSACRCPIPVLGLSDSPETVRRMSIYWGVIPRLTTLIHGDPRTLLQEVVQWGLSRGLLTSGSKVVLVASSNHADTEGHDLLLVHAIP